MTPESSLILSIPQIRLCMNVLGCGQWDDLPLLDTGEPAEQRLLNAFLHLIRTERFLPVEGGYEMEPALRRQMLRIAEADRVYHLYGKERILAFLYEKDGDLTVISPDPGNREHCKVSSFTGAAREDVLAWSSGPAARPEDLQLRPARDSEAHMGRYDISKLDLFLGIDTGTEDAG